MTVKVRLSSTIINEYATRGVYDEIAPWGAKSGTYILTDEQARELLDDAKYFVFDTDMTPSGVVRAYAALASNLMQALDVTC